VALRDVEQLSARAGRVQLDDVIVRAVDGQDLLTHVQLLRAPGFEGSLRAPPTARVAPARRGEDHGWVLVLGTGVLFVPAENVLTLERVVAEVEQPVPPDRFLFMLAHVSPARWATVVDLLERHDADWLPRGELVVTGRDDGHELTVVSGLVSLRIALPAGTLGAQHQRSMLELLGASLPSTS
jgi:hypothetical protein